MNRNIKTGKRWAQWGGLLAALTLAFSLGCAEKQQEPTQGYQASETATIDFEEGQAYLSQDAREQIRQLVDDFRQTGQIEEASVAVWSDQEFPMEGQELTEEQKELAENRQENVEEFLEEQLGVGNLQVYNMATRPSWWASTFNTEEAELKSQFARRGGQQQMEDPAYKAFQEEGGPSQAVIFVQGRKYDQQQSQPSM